MTRKLNLKFFSKNAGTECCAIPSATVTDEETAATALDVLATLVPKVGVALTSISTNKPDFDSILLATGLVKTAIDNLGSEANTLIDCLAKITPADSMVFVSGYAKQVNNVIAHAKKSPKSDGLF
jgi:hypothetical protein